MYSFCINIEGSNPYTNKILIRQKKKLSGHILMIDRRMHFSHPTIFRHSCGPLFPSMETLSPVSNGSIKRPQKAIVYI